jgi:hypothetical protein
MRIDRAMLDEAVSDHILSSEQADRLIAFLAKRSDAAPSFRFTTVLYYLGGLIAMGAMTLFMTLGWERFGGAGICMIAVAYIIFALWLTTYFERQSHLIPAGITGALAVALVPLAVYGLQHWLGYWAGSQPYRDYHYIIDWRWLMMEFATLAAGAIMLWRFRLPFMVMPIAVTLWYMSMDLAPFLAGGSGDPYNWEIRKFVSLWFGAAMCLFAFWVDLRSRKGKDFAFWLYLFGAVAFWGGLTSMDSNSELGKFVYCLINVALLFIGAILGRRIFAVLGGLGVAFYLGHLAQRVFRDSMLFPLVLSAIGLGVVYLGIVWQRHETAITLRLRAILPATLRELIEARE